MSLLFASFYFVVFNVVPWLSTIPGIIAGGFLTKKLQADGLTVAKTRKIVEGICMITEAMCLLLIGTFYTLVTRYIKSSFKHIMIIFMYKYWFVSNVGVILFHNRPM